MVRKYKTQKEAIEKIKKMSAYGEHLIEIAGRLHLVRVKVKVSSLLNANDHFIPVDTLLEGKEKA